MQLEYNPFKRKEYKETEHGIINYQHDMGKIYVTHRKPEHYFVKYKGFAISMSELEIAFNEHVYWIMIIYHNKDGTTTPYKIKLENVKYLQEYNNKGDIQKVFPLKMMEEIK